MSNELSPVRFSLQSMSRDQSPLTSQTNSPTTSLSSSPYMSPFNSPPPSPKKNSPSRSRKSSRAARPALSDIHSLYSESPKFTITGKVSYIELQEKMTAEPSVEELSRRTTVDSETPSPSCSQGQSPSPVLTSTETTPKKVSKNPAFRKIQFPQPQLNDSEPLSPSTSQDESPSPASQSPETTPEKVSKKTKPQKKPKASRRLGFETHKDYRGQDYPLVFPGDFMFYPPY